MVRMGLFIVPILAVCAAAADRAEERLQVMSQVPRQFAEGIAPVVIDGKWIIVDARGAEVARLPLDTSYAGDFNNGVAAYKSAGKWGFIDLKGAVIIKPQYSGVRFGWAKSGLIGVSEEVSDNGVKAIRWGFITSTGNRAIAARFSNVQNFSEGLCAVQQEGRWCYVDCDGERAFGDLTFVAAQPFSEGLAAVMRKDRWSYISRNGQQAIEQGFLSASPYSEGVAAVRTESGWGYLSQSGEWRIAPRFEDAAPFILGRAIVNERRASQYFIDHKATTVAANAFVGFSSGFGVTTPKNGVFNIIDTRGDVIATFRCRFLWPPSEGRVWVLDDEEVRLMSISGDTIRRYSFDGPLKSFAESLPR